MGFMGFNRGMYREACWPIAFCWFHEHRKTARQAVAASHAARQGRSFFGIMALQSRRDKIIGQNITVAVLWFPTVLR